MEQILQTLIVATIVAASAVFAGWKLLPARTKLRLLDASKPSTSGLLGRWILQRREKVLAELTHGCGACSQSSLKKPAASKR